VRRGEQHAHRPAAADAEQNRTFRAGFGHDDVDVVHPQVERAQLVEGDWIGDTASALVERDQACEGIEPLEEGGEVGLVPLHLDRVPELRREHNVDRSLADDLVGNVNVARLRVARLDRRARQGRTLD
jgi:hypothetical protein